MIETGAASVQTNPSFQTASKDFDSSARVTAFLDPTVFSNIEDAKVKEFVDSYFKPAGPMTGTLVVKPAGFVTSLTGRIIGSKLPKASELRSAGRVAVTEPLACRPRRSSLRRVSNRNEVERRRSAESCCWTSSGPPIHARSAKSNRGLLQMEQALGVSLAKLVDGLGTEAVLAMARAQRCRPGSKASSPKGRRQAAKFNVTWVQQLKDDTEYKRLGGAAEAEDHSHRARRQA